ncbi:uroporphyrinogen III synthase HEM4 [Psychromonas sp. psych-6C06]|uniref:uroporphyrinogen-III synthase n=1 Tax=Psychromonas sp. psych-6C06 TaxID=2058089 RepID=UPI000C324412|nr:uroporphyrinogen-III synthase [Psychromonas sp. psych-6C06]PKF61393.1 uroporphyrinogen III synthase HEM4 [Psychromonas sp. psych-6C06]
MVKPRLLITRFAPHGQYLAERLSEQGIYSLAQPLLTIEPIPHLDYPFVHHYDFIIAVSANAVEYTDLSLHNKTWPQCNYIAVGDATQHLLAEKTKQFVEVPISSFNSEGVLALPKLQQLDNRSVLILRGVGGRELLKETLLARGASVDYFESYQRVAISLPRSMTIDKWQQHAINGAIISSVELLEQLIILTPDSQLNWLKTITIYAASERILNFAYANGFVKRVLLPSIASQDIIDYFK